MSSGTPTSNEFPDKPDAVCLSASTNQGLRQNSMCLKVFTGFHMFLWFLRLERALHRSLVMPMRKTWSSNGRSNIFLRRTCFTLKQHVCAATTLNILWGMPASVQSRTKHHKTFPKTSRNHSINIHLLSNLIFATVLITFTWQLCSSVESAHNSSKGRKSYSFQSKPCRRQTNKTKTQLVKVFWDTTPMLHRSSCSLPEHHFFA